MSYDLFFFKTKKSILTKEQIMEYLSAATDYTNKEKNQWVIENNDTETYFYFNFDEKENVDILSSSIEFKYTYFSFHLNFIRPNFFGQYAFNFITKMLAELDLYILNPQSKINSDTPYKPTMEELHQEWDCINKRHCENYFEKYKLNYYPLEESNNFYQYNLNRILLQQKVGDDIYVPRLYFFKKINNGIVITVAFLIDDVPNILPLADYYVLLTNYNKSLKKYEETGVITKEAMFNKFGKILVNYCSMDYKIIHFEQINRAKDFFNSVQIESTLLKFANRITSDKIVNVKPLK